MRYSITHGCPNCHKTLIRSISPERYEKLTGKKADGIPYMCHHDEKKAQKGEETGCGHVWCVKKAVLQR